MAALSEKELDALLAKKQSTAVSEEELDSLLSGKTNKKEPMTRDAEIGDFIPNSDTLTAIASGFNDGSTFGYGANVGAATTDPLNYVKTRDALQKQNDDFDRTNVLARATGKTIGGLASAAALPFSKMAEGAGYLGRLAGITADSYAAGAVMNPGNTEGEASPLQLNQRLDNANESAKYGALLGGGIDGGLSLKNQMPNIKNKIGETLKGTAETLAFKSTGARLPDYRVNDVKAVGRYLLDKGAIKPGDSVEDIAVKTAQYKEQAGKLLDEVYSNAEKKLKETMSFVGFDPVKDKNRILSAAKAELGDAVGADAELKRLSGYLDEVASKNQNPEYVNQMAKYNQDKQKYAQDVNQYRKDSKDYRRQLGDAGENPDQQVLPVFSDDMQRTGQRSQQVEINGNQASRMQAEPLENWSQGELDSINLPQRPQQGFNPARGDDLLPLRQQMDMDKRFLGDLGEGYQGEILGTQNTPRSYSSGQVTMINQGQGQMQFAIAPNRPQRPQIPDIKNSMSPRRTNDIKGAIDDEINYARDPLKKEPAKEKAFLGARRELNKIIDESIDTLGGSEAAQQLKSANKEYGMAAKVNKISKDRINRENSNKMFGLTDTIAATGAGAYSLATGDIFTGLGILGAKKGFEKYGTTGLAVLADEASKRLLSNPQLKQMAASNPAQFNAVVLNIVERAAAKNNPELNQMPAAAENESRQKGPDEWAAETSEEVSALANISPDVANDVVSKTAKALLSTEKIAIMAEKNPEAFRNLLLSTASKKVKENSDQKQADVVAVMQTMSPYDREQYIRNDRSLKPTQKAQLLKENKYANQKAGI